MVQSLLNDWNLKPFRLMLYACVKLFLRLLCLLYACFARFACIPAAERRSAACARHDKQRSRYASKASKAS